jgi:hypothetical protein
MTAFRIVSTAILALQLATVAGHTADITPARFGAFIQIGMERAAVIELLGEPSVQSCSKVVAVTTCTLVWQPLLSVHRFRVTLVNGRVVTQAVCSRSGLFAGENQCARM